MIYVEKKKGRWVWGVSNFGARWPLDIPQDSSLDFIRGYCWGAWKDQQVEITVDA